METSGYSISDRSLNDKINETIEFKELTNQLGRQMAWWSPFHSPQPVSDPSNQVNPWNRLKRPQTVGVSPSTDWNRRSADSVKLVNQTVGSVGLMEG